MQSRVNFIPNTLDGCVPLTAQTPGIIAHEEYFFADWLTATVPTLLDLVLLILVKVLHISIENSIKYCICFTLRLLL